MIYLVKLNSKKKYKISLKHIYKLTNIRFNQILNVNKLGKKIN